MIPVTTSRGERQTVRGYRDETPRVAKLIGEWYKRKVARSSLELKRLYGQAVVMGTLRLEQSQAAG
jgi:hypothetical protein